MTRRAEQTRSEPTRTITLTLAAAVTIVAAVCIVLQRPFSHVERTSMLFGYNDIRAQHSDLYIDSDTLLSQRVSGPSIQDTRTYRELNGTSARLTYTVPAPITEPLAFSLRHGAHPHTDLSVELGCTDCHGAPLLPLSLQWNIDSQELPVRTIQTSTGNVYLYGSTANDLPANVSVDTALQYAKQKNVPVLITPEALHQVPLRSVQQESLTVSDQSTTVPLLILQQNTQ